MFHSNSLGICSGIGSEFYGPSIYSMGQKFICQWKGKWGGTAKVAALVAVYISMNLMELLWFHPLMKGTVT